jgi:hypothetical protein
MSRNSDALMRVRPERFAEAFGIEDLDVGHGRAGSV